MLIVVVLAISAVAVLGRARRGRGQSDAPARIVVAAASRLPADRRDWGRAMVAELAHIQGRARWQFTAGVLHVAMFPPPQRRSRTLAVALVGLTLAAAATMAAAREVPSLSVFAALLGLLLCGYATVVTARSRRLRRTAAHMIVGAVALLGVAATIASLVWTAAAHPEATIDPTHVFPVICATVLTAYIALALARPHLGDDTDAVLWWALAAAVACGAVWAVSALTTSVGSEGTVGFLWLTGAAASLAVAIGVSAATRSRSAGARAGLLTAILTAPIHFAVDMTALLRINDYTLTSPYDIAAYPHSSYSDVASYILSDAVAGEIISGLVLYPIILVALALLGAAVGAALHRIASPRTIA
jgi:hypothetical protein